MVIFQTSREGSALFLDVVPVSRAVEFKMATGCKFLSLAASDVYHGNMLSKHHRDSSPLAKASRWNLSKFVVIKHVG